MVSLNTAILTNHDSSAPAESPKRIAIIEAATRLFLDSGYDAVSMDAIAEAAKVSKRTVYSHFSNKETLFGGVMQTMCRRFNRMDPSGDLPDDPPDQVLTMLGMDFVTLITSPEAIALFRTVIAEAPRHPELAETFYQNGPDPFCDVLSRYFDAQTAKGTLSISETTDAAHQFWELIKAPFHLKMLLGLAERPDDATIRLSVEVTVTHFLRMYRATS